MLYNGLANRKLRKKYLEVISLWHFLICLDGARRLRLPPLPAVLPAVQPTSPRKLPLLAALPVVQLISLRKPLLLAALPVVQLTSLRKPPLLAAAPAAPVTRLSNS